MTGRALHVKVILRSAFTNELSYKKGDLISFGIGTDYGLNGLGSIPSSSEIFFWPPHRLDRLWDPPSWISIHPFQFTSSPTIRHWRASLKVVRKMGQNQQTVILHACVCVSEAFWTCCGQGYLNFRTKRGFVVEDIILHKYVKP
jgi:hypothetical protein